MARAIILVVDGFGIGHAPDAEKFGDVTANTFAHLAEAFACKEGRLLDVPQLAKMGLIKASEKVGNLAVKANSYQASKGAFGYAAEISSGKDTPSGHWEMAGVPVLFDWGYFNDKTNSFPPDLIEKIQSVSNINGILANCHASGTEIIAKYGEEHIKTGFPICYTSADSVFQIAAHEEHFGLDNLYKYCEQVRELLAGMNIGRVIARPFIGDNADNFTRTGNRRDYSLLPPDTTVLDKLHQAGGTVISIGKIADIFAHQGISEKYKATGLAELIDTTIHQIKVAKDNSLIFTNLVNFDQDFGHRRDPVGYGHALEYFDSRLAHVLDNLKDDDVLFITSDHGCDPTWPGSDHTREYVPIMAFHNTIGSVDLGERSTFADLGQTLADLFKLTPMAYGSSFLSRLDFNRG